MCVNNIGCIVCSHIVYDDQPVLFASHAGGEWALLCSEDFHAADDYDSRGLTVVHFSHIVSQDKTLKTLLSLPINWAATRKEMGDKWKYIDDYEDFPSPDEGDVIGICEEQYDSIIKPFIMMKEFYFPVHEGKIPCIVEFDTGLRVFPIWNNLKNAQDALMGPMKNKELVSIKKSSLIDYLSTSSIPDDQVLCLNFLYLNYDLVVKNSRFKQFITEYDCRP